MKYFQSTPKIAVTDKYGNSVIYRNIMARLSIIPAVLKNPLLYYEYDVQEGDTPEIVAHKYYGNVNRYWIVLFSNQMMDPQWDWPLDYRNLASYIEDKYENPEAIHSYQKIITLTNLLENNTTVNTYTISEAEYNDIVEETKTIEMASGVVIYQLEKKSLTNYEYEVESNDSKRSIKLLNRDYASQLEQEFQALMS
jgi:hypothetical protein